MLRADSHRRSNAAGNRRGQLLNERKTINTQPPRIDIQVQGNLIDVKSISPDVAVASGNKNGASGIVKNHVAGNQDEKLSVEQYQNMENSQSGGGGGGLLAGLL